MSPYDFTFAFLFIFLIAGYCWRSMRKKDRLCAGRKRRSTLVYIVGIYDGYPWKEAKKHNKNKTQAVKRKEGSNEGIKEDFITITS